MALDFISRRFSCLFLGGMLLLAPQLRAESEGTESTEQAGPVDRTVRLSGLSPEKGNVRGGFVIRIEGQNFAPGIQVFIGGKECTSLRILGPNDLECQVPEHAAGVEPVLFKGPDGVFRGTTLNVLYYRDVKLEPGTIRAIVGKKFQLTATGGAAPYSFAVVRGEGTVDQQGMLTLPEAAGIGLVEVKDKFGNAAYTSYQAFSAVALIPESHTMLTDELVRVGAYGGLPPYQISKISGDGKLYEGFLFRSPSKPSSTVLRVTDSQGNSADVTITTNKAEPTKPGQSGDSREVEFRKRQVAVGAEHSCALLDGKVHCWGSNTSGQLGNAAPRRGTTTPKKTLGLDEEIVSVVAGMNHTCALSRTGNLKCWGDNRFGQLGDGTKELKRQPAQVLGMETGVQGVVAGEFFTCAVHTFQLFCWGRNDHGQLGFGTRSGGGTSWLTPDMVSAISGKITGFSAGSSHTCVVVDGTIKCWGNNFNGQLGRGDRRSSLAPVTVPGFTAESKVEDVVAGLAHTCALAAGTIKCWGFNGIGTLGLGSTQDMKVPGDVKGLTFGVSALTGGQYHNCAISNGEVYCWGYNYQGQVGDSTIQNKAIPTVVKALGNSAADVATGTNHSCAKLDNGEVACWGENFAGQLGDGSNETRTLPVRVKLPKK